MADRDNALRSQRLQNRIPSEMRLAFTTILVLRHPYGHPDIVSYEERVEPVFGDAENSPGFIDRARRIDPDETKTNFEWDYGPWGAFTTPRFYTGGRLAEAASRASTLSIWTDLVSVRTFLRSEGHRHTVRDQTPKTARPGAFEGALAG